MIYVNSYIVSRQTDTTLTKTETTVCRHMYTLAFLLIIITKKAQILRQDTR